MGCAQARLRSKVDVRDLEQMVRTGDLVLFSSKHAAAQVTKCFTASTWDHCGVVIKFSRRHVFILEYAGGVFLYPLFTRLYTYFAVQGREISLRRLMPGQDREEMQRRVETFVRGVLGQKPPSIEEIVVAVLKQETLVSSFLAKLAGARSDGAQPEHVDDLETLFCSKLIAAVYKDIGLLAPHRKTSDFLPKHFSQRYDEYMDLQRGALLGPELPINFDSVSDEIEHIQQRMAEDSRKRPEAVVQAVSEFYVAATRGFAGFGAELSERFRSMERGLHGWSEAAEAALQRSMYPSAEDNDNGDGEGGGGSYPCSGAPPDGPPLAGHPPPPPKGEADPFSAPLLTPPPPVAVRGGGPRDDKYRGPPARLSSSGGLELRSGAIVDEVMNVHDGGVYSPPKYGVGEPPSAPAPPLSPAGAAATPLPLVPRNSSEPISAHSVAPKERLLSKGTDSSI